LHTSVVICAYTEDRWDVMGQGIEAVLNQSLPPDEIVVVIDHNPALLERVRQRFPQIIVTENVETQGLSGARNSGVAASHGDLVVFLDDDAVPDPDWLETLVACFDDPKVVGAGSNVAPMWMVPRPRWFPDEFYWTVGCSYRGQPTQRAEVRNPTGAGMGILREAFDAIGTFRIGIGRKGAVPLGCEETELCIRIRQRWPERVFVHEPAARVCHQITAKRATWSYFWSRCYAEGLSKALVAGLVGQGDALSAERSHVLRVLPAGILRGIGDALLHFDLGGLGRAWAIFAGTFVTAAGYAAGRLRNEGGQDV
jgi:glucosyl-dolichyl phosphate glucuronosyltransferase